MTGELRTLRIGDDAAAWEAAGFHVMHDRLVLGDVVVDLVGAGGTRGILGWHLTDVDTDIDGLEGVPDLSAEVDDPPRHPNGIESIDHVVVRTDDFARSVPAFEAHGIRERRSRKLGSAEGEAQTRQSFFWIGAVILELVGPVLPEQGGGAAAEFWGLALTSAELDATVAFLGDLATGPKAAVQRGRRISTIRTREIGISVPLAVMSPHVRGGD